MEKQEIEIEEIMQQLEEVRGPVADQEALYEEAWEIWEQENETREP